MWDNEGGKCSVVLLNDIYKDDKDEKLVIGKNYKVKYGSDNFDGVLKMIDTRNRCDSKINAMSNTIDTDKNSAGLKHALKQRDGVDSVEMDSLKNELNIVKKALEDQQTIIKNLDGEL